MMNSFLNLVIAACIAGKVMCACCPNGWVAYDSSCYLFPRNHASTFTEAQHYCRQHHSSHLIEIESAAENLFIKDFLRGMKDEGHWLGLTDEQTEGVWRWYSSDSVPLVTDWYPGRPDNSGDEDCAVFWYSEDYKCDDISCMRKSEPICEIRLDSEPVVG